MTPSRLSTSSRVATTNYVASFFWAFAHGQTISVSSLTRIAGCPILIHPRVSPWLTTINCVYYPQRIHRRFPASYW